MDSLTLNNTTYTIGMQLLCIGHNSEHGGPGHILEIASINKEPRQIPLWCHGIKGFPRGKQLAQQYPEGNYGLSERNIKDYRILSGDWDT